MHATEIVAHSDVCVFSGCTEIESEILVPFVFEARRRRNRIQDPLRLKSPTNSTAGNDRILAFHINANAENQLKIGTIDISATDLEGHVEIGRSWPERFAVDSRRRFDPDAN